MSLSAANLTESIYNDRVLLIESNDEMRRVFEEQLEFSGYEVHCAKSLPEALNVMEYMPVNLIVCNEFFGGGETIMKYLPLFKAMGIVSSLLILTDNEERVLSQHDDQEGFIYTFPIPKNMDEFFKADINQFIAIVAMVLDDLKCVMIISDSSSERIELENLLIARNFRICSVNGGNQALPLILKALKTPHKFDLILMDVINRYYPGFVFLEDLLQVGVWIPVMILTKPNNTLDIVQEKTQYTISAVLPKSEVFSQLMSSVDTILYPALT